MNNYIWAKAYWNFFHIITVNLNETKLNIHNLAVFHNFINKLLINIPCLKCKTDALRYFKFYNFVSIKKKSDFIIFFYNFHNYVNKKINKQQFNIKVLDIYKNITINRYYTIINRYIFNNNLHSNNYKMLNNLII